MFLTKARSPSKVEVAIQQLKEGDRGGTRDTYHTPVYSCNGAGDSERDRVSVERTSGSVDVEDFGAGPDEL